MESIATKPIPVRRLAKLLDSGIFAVPELQREFVWSARRACDLLDSITRNYPIGTIMIWKTDGRNENQLRAKLHILPPYNDSNDDIYFLIDGQQRLSVLWNVLRGQPATVMNADGREVDFGAIYFNALAKHGERRFIYRKRLGGELSRSAVPVVDMLSSSWHVRLPRLGKRTRRAVDACRRSIRDYRVFLTFCETNSLPEVRETFIRINALGMRVGTADRAFARATRFDMRGHVRDVQVRLKQGFDGIKRTTILQTIALALGHKDLGERGIDAMITRLERDPAERQAFHKLWPPLREAFGRAVDFAVAELGVPNFDFLPSEPMMAVLSLFFFHNGNARPSRAAKRRLRQWFWCTAVGARYTGRGYRPNILADAGFVQRLAETPKAQGSYAVSVPRHILKTIDYRRPGPLSNAFLCLLRLNVPRYLEDGAPVPSVEISSRSNRHDKHHIFPRALLSRHGIAQDRHHCLLNICYLVARENQHIGKTAPRVYLRDVPRNGHARRAAMQSHMIPNTRDSGVWDRSVKRGFKNFLLERTHLLVRRFEEEAGTRLFEKD
jgi:hypothetical protein